MDNKEKLHKKHVNQKTIKTPMDTITSTRAKLKNIDNRVKVSQNPDEIFSLFSKKLEDKVFTSHAKVRENASIQNEKPQRAGK